jgi:hypothetical protein
MCSWVKRLWGCWFWVVPRRAAELYHEAPFLGGSQGKVPGVAISLPRLYNWCIMVWYPARAKIFVFYKGSGLTMGPTQFTVQWIAGATWPEGEYDHSPPSKAEVKNEWSHTSTPNMLSWLVWEELYLDHPFCFLFLQPSYRFPGGGGGGCGGLVLLFRIITFKWITLKSKFPWICKLQIFFSCVIGHWNTENPHCRILLHPYL